MTPVFCVQCAHALPLLKLHVHCQTVNCDNHCRCMHTVDSNSLHTEHNKTQERRKHELTQRSRTEHKTTGQNTTQQNTAQHMRVRAHSDNADPGACSRLRHSSLNAPNLLPTRHVSIKERRFDSCCDYDSACEPVKCTGCIRLSVPRCRYEPGPGNGMFLKCSVRGKKRQGRDASLSPES